MRMRFLTLINCFAGSTFLVLCVLLMGCGMSNSVDDAGTSGSGLSKMSLGLNGSVHGGRNPILGGTI